MTKFVRLWRKTGLSRISSFPTATIHNLESCANPIARRIEVSKLQRRCILSSAVTLRINTMMKRHEEIMEEMKSAGHTSPGLGKELSSLSTVYSLQKQRANLDEEEIALQELMDEASTIADKDMQRECENELQRVDRERAVLEGLIVDAVLPEDEDDYESDAIIEIRAGTGGDEASLFASELLEAYQKAAMAIRWKVEVLAESRTDIGGIREASISISGNASFRLPTTDSEREDSGPLLGPYGAFKFESGVHRVQRVPINDSRIHTSACSIAVLPFVSSISNEKELLPMSELRIETMRSSGAGGQHVNTTDSAVRITHLPTGITAAIQDERSQHKNKAKALKLITARVRDRQRTDAQLARGELRSNLMGGGDRSERIRTYNYPQDRITDHRCKVSKTGISAMLNDGENGIVVFYLPLLKAMHREELLEQLEDDR